VERCADAATLGTYTNRSFRLAVEGYHLFNLEPPPGSNSHHRRNQRPGPKFYWCPVVECGGGKLHDAARMDDSEEVVCDRCGYHFCGRHGGIKWHEGFDCDAWDKEQERQRKRREVEDGMSERTVEKTTKKCPGVGCGVPTVKNGGWYVFFFFFFSFFCLWHSSNMF